VGPELVENEIAIVERILVVASVAFVSSVVNLCFSG